MTASSISSVVSSDPFSRLEIPPTDDVINALPNEIFLEIFQLLPRSSLVHVENVCRKWKELVGDQLLPLTVYMNTFYPKLNVRVIDETFWNRFDIPGLPKIPVKILSLYDKEVLCRRIEEEMKKISGKIKGDAGATLLTMPPISLKTLMKIAKNWNSEMNNPKGSSSALFLFGKFYSEKPERMLIANSILKRSQCASVITHIKSVEDIGWKVPCIRHIAALAFATFVMTAERGDPVRLFGDSPKIFARCSDFVSMSDRLAFSVAFGKFSSNGFSVIMSPNNMCDKSTGVALALRSF